MLLVLLVTDYQVFMTIQPTTTGATGSATTDAGLLPTEKASPDCRREESCCLPASVTKKGTSFGEKRCSFCKKEPLLGDREALFFDREALFGDQRPLCGDSEALSRKVSALSDAYGIVHSRYV